MPNTVTITTRTDLEPLRQVVERAADTRPAFGAIAGRAEDQIRGEFAQGRSADGIRWLPRQPFGADPGGPSHLEESGLLLRTWMGGPGAIRNIQHNRLRFGVSGKRVPYGHLVRSGGTIAVTSKMRRYLAASGRPLRASTRELLIPARPHAEFGPRLRGEAVDVLRGWLVRGEART